MGTIDAFIGAQLTPHLLAGEQIHWTGFVRRPAKINPLGVVGEYPEGWLAAATNQRLVLMLTETSGFMTATPKPLCKEVVTWWYQELKEVTLGRCVNSSGVFFGLIPHEPLGPFQGGGKRYDAFPTAEGADGQGQFFAQFPQWLQQQVAAQAFPMDAERQARIQAHWQGQQAAAAADAARRQEAAQRRAEAARRMAGALGRATPFIAPVLVGLVALALAATGAVAVVDGLESQANSGKRLAQASGLEEVYEAAKKRAAKGKEPPDDCPEKELGLPRGESFCHGCYVTDTRASASGAQVFTKGSDYWSCPSEDEYDEMLEQARRDREAAEDDRDEVAIQVAAGAAGGGVGLVAGAVFFVWYARRRKRLAASAAA